MSHSDTITGPTLAAAMLAAAPTADLAELLVEVADHASIAPVLPHGQISAAAAARLAPSNPAWAIAVAPDPRTAPELLALLAEHESPRVRDDVLTNPSTPLETILTRFHALVADRDTNRAAKVAHRVEPVTWLTAVAAEGLRVPAKTSSELVARVATETDTGRADTLIQIAADTPTFTELRAALGAAAASGGPFQLPQRLLEAPTAIVADFVRGLVRETNGWTDASTDWFCQAGLRLEGHQQPNPSTVIGHRLNDYQVRQLTAHPSTLAMRALFSADNAADFATAGLVHMAAQSGPAAACRSILANEDLLELASASDVDMLVARAELEKGAGLLATTVLARPAAADYAPATVLALLQGATTALIGHWVTGGFPAAPTLELLHAVARLPRFAEGDAHPSSSSSGHPHEEFALTVLDTIDRHRETPGPVSDAFATLMDWAGPHVLHRATMDDSGNVYATHLAHRITARFGTDPAAWQAVLRLAPSLAGGTVTALLDTIEAVLADPANTP